MRNLLICAFLALGACSAEPVVIVSEPDWSNEAFKHGMALDDLANIASANAAYCSSIALTTSNTKLASFAVANSIGWKDMHDALKQESNHARVVYRGK